MGHKKDTILIVEDTEINIILLEKVLSQEYDIAIAGNGEEALEKLSDPANKISAVLLDLMMPVMDGFQVMANMQQRGLMHIPVIVMTGETDPVVEEKALVMGAVDFVPKPYKPRILKTRIANAIARSEMTHMEQLRHTAEHDSLTDLYNRTTFFRQIMGYATLHENEPLVFVRIDIRRFHLVNSLFGESTGDALLIFVAQKIRAYVDRLDWGVYGRIESDIFGMFIPYDEEELIPSLEELGREIGEYRKDYTVSCAFGVYKVRPTDYSAENMFMCASQASKSIKHHYTHMVGFYDVEMGEQMIREQEIVQDMKRALDEQEFIVYYQPKYDVDKRLPFGAEALVRWKHKDVGMISPGVFVPIFERNGFIGELDYYIWDHVCAAIRRWLDAGLDPAPISVNMSRADLSDPNLTANLTGLIKKYDLPPTMLYLELTESAYMDNPELMDHTLRSLHEAGFIILMDDFGSGYSSLNTLKDISVDILKIDMKFLSKDIQDMKSNKIITAVVQMAHSLYMPVIVEGVETEDQYEFLKEIGCEYIQGYFFSRPVPEEEYERMISAEEVKNGVAKIRQETFQKALEEHEKQRDDKRISISDMDIYGNPEAFVRRGKEQPLDSMVYRDPLTGVFNRNYIYDWRFWSEREKGRISFLLIDLRWYTDLRNTWGQAAAEGIIKQVAKALMQVAGPRDVIVRYGGDVFLMMLKQVNDSMIPALVRRINSILSGLDWEGKDKFRITADYGFSSVEDFEQFYHDSAHLDSMLHAAEVRLLYNKDKVEPIRKAVLLVEKPSDEREELHQALRKEAELIIVAEAAEAEEFLEHNHVDMVILDTTRDNGENFALITRLGNDARLSGVRLIAIADASVEMEMKVLRAGVDDFITEPLNVELLMHRIRRNLSGGRSSARRISENHFLFNQIHIPYAVAHLVKEESGERVVFSYVNEAFEQELKKSREEILRSGIFAEQEMVSMLKRAGSSEKSLRQSFQDEQTGCYYDLTVYDDGDDYYGIIAFENLHYAVMAKEKQHYEEIRERELMLSSLTENIPGGIVIFRLLSETEFTADFISEALLRLLGRETSAFAGHKPISFQDLIDPEDIPKLAQVFRRAYQEGIRVNITFRFLHNIDKHPIWVSVSGAEIRKEDGHPIYYTVFTPIPEEVGGYQQTIEDAPSGIVVFAQDTLQMLYANKQAREFFGWGEDYSQMKCPEFIRSDEESYDPKRLREIPEEGYLEYELSNSDVGKKLVCMTRQIDWNKRPAYISYIVDDTYRVIAQEEAIKYEKAKAENKAKSDFMARMSHDLRTPLNAIIGFSDIASIRTGSRDECEEYFDKIHVSGEYLLSLINDILDVSRMENNSIRIVEKPAKLDELAEEIRSMVEPMALAKHQRFTFEDLGSGAATVMTDPVRLRQIIMNLIGNAIKFTPPEGRISAELIREEMEDELVHLSVVVKDNGIGMSEDFLAKAFEPFTQEHNDNGSEGGTGLGLTITKSLVDAMGGTIECESVQGRGTTFIVSMDLKRVTPEKKSEEELIRLGADLDLTGKRLLLVEDHPMNMQIARILLEKKHARVEVAEDGQIGVERFASSPEGYFDGILMDIRMPNMDGLAATREIRKLPRPDAAEIPIIAMTANAYAEDVQKALDAGMNEHLAKPVDPKKLYATLAVFFRQES